MGLTLKLPKLAKVMLVVFSGPSLRLFFTCTSVGNGHGVGIFLQ